MSNMSDFLADEVLDHLFGKGVYNPPTIYVGLSTADPTDDGSGIAEPGGGSYARKVTAGADWAVSASREIDNAEIITFVTATGAWGTITHFFLSDAISGGNMLGHGVLTAQKVVGDTDIVRFAVGALTVTIPAS